MENASKALLIAAAILIVILVIAFGMKVFDSASTAGDAAEASNQIGSAISQAGSSIQQAISQIGGGTSPAVSLDTQVSNYLNTNNRSKTDVKNLITILIDNNNSEYTLYIDNSGHMYNTILNSESTGAKDKNMLQDVAETVINSQADTTTFNISGSTVDKKIIIYCNR